MLGGAIANRRRRERGERDFRAQVEQANHDLAQARASDRGWEPERMEAAARQVFAARDPQAAIASIELVQVVDRPGTDDDEAVFRVQAGGDAHTVRLGRRGDEWIPA